jgi:hypothetical protein
MTNPPPPSDWNTYRKLVLGKAAKKTGGEIAQDLLVAAIAALLISFLLYLGTIGKTFAVDEIKSYLIFALGVGIFIVITFILNIFRGTHSVWVADQQRITDQENRIGDLEVRMEPRIVLFPSFVGHRHSPDREWMTVTMTAYNTGIDAAVDCYVKLMGIWSMAVAEQPPLVPAFGTTFRWCDRNDALTCTIAGASNECFGLAVRARSAPQTWYLYSDAPTRANPLPEGIWGVTLEVGAANIAARRTEWRITYISPDNFVMELTNPPPVPAPQLAPPPSEISA